MNSSTLRVISFSLLCLFALTAWGQSEKPHIVFQPFQVSATSGKDQGPVLYEMTLNQLMELNKFSLVNRTPEMWKAIEDELKVQDFIEPSTAVNLGKMSGAKFLLMGDLSHFSCDRKVRTTSDNKIDYYFSSSVSASLKLIDLESGQYKESVLSEITVDHADREISIREALQKTTADLVSKLSKKFLIHASIKSMSSPEAIRINKGSQDGVKQFAAFYVMDTRQEQPVKLATIKITSVSLDEATGKLLSGDFNTLAVGNEVVESPEYEANVISVKEKTQNRVTINGGANLNIKEGDLYSLSDDDKKNGLVYIKEVKKDHAVGKVLYGNKYVVPGVTLSESGKDQSIRRSFVGVGFKSAVGVTIKASKPAGIVSVNNKNGNFLIDTQYLDQYEDISNVYVYSFHIGGKNLVKDLTTSLNFDIYDMSPLRNWIAHLDVLSERPLIHDKLYVAYGGGIGFGQLKQTVKDNVVETISNGESGDLRARSIFLSGMVDLRYTINRFVLHAGLSYDYMRFKNWEYKINHEDEEAEQSAPSEIIPYQDVNLSGLYFNVGVAFKFKK